MAFSYRSIFPVFSVLLFIMLMLCNGCSDGSGTTPEELALPGRLMISNLEFADDNLAACVDRSVDANGWVYADEITQIECINEGIKSLEGIEAFSASSWGGPRA